MDFGKKIGDMLLEDGLLTQEQLNYALARHKRANMKLGQFLVREGALDEFQVMSVISRQMGVETYRPETFSFDESLAKAVPFEVAQKHHVAPIKKRDGLLTVAMTDPMDIKALDYIEEFTGMELEAVLCSEEQFNFLIMTLYGANLGLGGLMENMEITSADKDEEAAETTDIEVSSLQDMAEEAPVVRLVNSILSQAVREGASDVHISPERDYVQVRFRVDGKLHDVPAPPKSMVLSIISRIKILANMDISMFRVPQDGRFTIKMDNKEVNIRASIIPTIYGENAVLRLLDRSAGILSLEQLGMEEEDMIKVESMMTKPFGMVLSTGPTGSGKTTSLYSILKRINQPDVNIITLEDPVEYRIEGIRQTQLNRKAGMTFASGIRSLLRQDPDVIMVGEIRDPETATIAVQAALTGHRVFSTIHTNNAAGAVTRFMDMGIEPFLISSVLLVSMAQRLVRRVCQYCKSPYDPPDAVLDFWGIEKTGDAAFTQAKGCYHCLNTGYKGRTGVFEVLIIDEEVSEMILRNESAHAITTAAERNGKLRTLKTNVAEKIKEGVTTFEEAATVVMV